MSVSIALSGSIAEPSTAFDLVLCIRMLEHMPEQEALEAITTMTGAAPRILFSSTPDDFDKPRHVSDRPMLILAASRRTPVLRQWSTMTRPICAHAMLLERADEDRTERDLAACGSRAPARCLMRRGAEDSSGDREIGRPQRALASELRCTNGRGSGSGERDSFDNRTPVAGVRRLAQHGADACGARVGWQVSTDGALVDADTPVASAVEERARGDFCRHKPKSWNLRRRGLSLPAAGTRRRRGRCAPFSTTTTLRTYAAPETDRRPALSPTASGEGFPVWERPHSADHRHAPRSASNASLRLITRTQPADVQRLKAVARGARDGMAGRDPSSCMPPTV